MKVKKIVPIGLMVLKSFIPDIGIAQEKDLPNNKNETSKEKIQKQTKKSLNTFFSISKDGIGPSGTPFIAGISHKSIISSKLNDKIFGCISNLGNTGIKSASSNFTGLGLKLLIHDGNLLSLGISNTNFWGILPEDTKMFVGLIKYYATLKAKKFPIRTTLNFNKFYADLKPHIINSYTELEKKFGKTNITAFMDFHFKNICKNYHKETYSAGLKLSYPLGNNSLKIITYGRYNLFYNLDMNKKITSGTSFGIGISSNINIKNK